MSKHISALVAAVTVCLCGCISQRAILYQPGGYDLAAARNMAESRGLRLWPTEDVSYLGLIGQDAAPNAEGTVVVFHGNGGVAAFRSFYVMALESIGFRVVLAEYPGYGGRPGKMSEKSFTRDAVAVIKQARKEFGPPVFVWGESLGAGAAAAAVAEDPSGVDGLVLFTPWDSLLNASRVHFPRLPVRLFLRDRYDSVSNLTGYRGPTAVVLAENDDVLPPRLGMNLYDSIPGRKRLWVMKGAGHNNWPAAPENPLWRDVTGYLSAEPAGVTGGGRNP